MSGAIKSVEVQWFEHKGEIVVAFSTPLTQWFLSHEAARELATSLLRMCDERVQADSAKALQPAPGIRVQ